MRRTTTLSAAQYRDTLEKTKHWARFTQTCESAQRHRGSMWQGSLDAATLHLEDVSGIPFVADIPGVEQYQHRARVRARTGDVFAAVTPMAEGYELYCRDELGLGSPGLVIADPFEGPMAVTRACQVGSALQKLSDWAAQQGRILVHPYMALAEVWELAEILERESGAKTEVVGPTPAALWIANDKAALMDLTDHLFGASAFPATRACTDVEILAQTALEFARRFDAIGIKRTRCASAMGNLVLSSERLLADPESLRPTLVDFLRQTEWEGDEDVLVVEWVRTDTSPSTQLWIPPLSGGSPILEGVYEQLLEGEEKVFLGSRPSTLPEPVNQAIGETSLHIATAFQAMGYVGRCSFDFIVGGDLEGEFRPLLTECNGRWGGTSTPMFLTDRFFPDARPHYIAQDYVDPNLVGAKFRDLYGLLAEELYDPNTGQGRFILYNVGPLENDGKFDIVSLGRTPDEAMEGVADIVPTRLGI